MKQVLLPYFFSFLIPFISYSQGCITIFSEDGDKFYLLLNAVKQNPTPQTNVRVDGLTNEFYNAKIIFDDPSKPEITKSIPTKDAATGQFAEMTFKIKKTKDGDLKLRYFSSTPIPVNYTPPPDMYLMHYGQPMTASTSTTVTQTTVTQSTNANPANISVNAGGVNMNVSISDPNGKSGGVNMNVNLPTGSNMSSGSNSTTQTTTTTTTNYGNNDNTQSSSSGCQYPMDYNSFKSAKETISQTSFDDTKLSSAKSVIAENCLSSDQVVEICNLFINEDNKLAFAKMAYSKTTDRANYFKVTNVFTFDQTKNDLNTFISNGGR